MESILLLSDSNEQVKDEKSEAAPPVITDSRNPEPISPSGKPPAPRKSFDMLRFKPGKKGLIGIIVVIIIIAVVLGAFFIYPMITNSEGVTNNGAALTTVPTNIKNSGNPRCAYSNRSAQLPETAVQRLDFNIYGINKNLKPGCSIQQNMNGSIFPGVF